MKRCGEEEGGEEEGRDLHAGSLAANRQGAADISGPGALARRRRGYHAAMEFPFEAVVFDLDGTLVATDQFWVPAARAATRRVFRERGIERPEPSAEEWMQLVGHPMRIGLRIVVPDLGAADLAALEAACVEEEERAMSSHGIQLLPGAEGMLADLKARGLQLGIASNCGGGYLKRVLAELGLGRWIDEARCLDSPGIHNKADMVEDLLLCFGTRRAIMVGDREGDMAAGRAHGLATLAYTGAFGDSAERMGADRATDDLAAVVGILASMTAPG